MVRRQPQRNDKAKNTYVMQICPACEKDNYGDAYWMRTRFIGEKHN